MHKAVPGGYDVTLREGKRTAVFGERPFFDPENSESLSERTQRLSVNGTDGTNGINGTKAVNGVSSGTKQNGVLPESK